MRLTDEEKKLVARALGEMMDPSEHMIERGCWQSHHYPVVPHGAETQKKPTHPFELRQVFREMVRTFASDNKIRLPKEP